MSGFLASLSPDTVPLAAISPPPPAPAFIPDPTFQGLPGTFPEMEMPSHTFASLEDYASTGSTVFGVGAGLLAAAASDGTLAVAGYAAAVSVGLGANFDAVGRVGSDLLYLPKPVVSLGGLQ